MSRKPLKAHELPSFPENLRRAIARDYASDPSSTVFARAFALGYGVSVGPDVLKSLIALAVLRRPEQLKTTLSKLRRTILRGFSTSSFALFLGLSFGGARWLERVIAPYIRRHRSPHAEALQTSHERRVEARKTRAWATFSASTVASLIALLIYQSGNRLRSRVSVVRPIPMTSAFPRDPIKPPRKNSPTLDLTLFSLVRAADTIGRALYWQYPAHKGSLRALLAQYADVLIFWVSCWRIMWCWFYLPSRLPSSYVRWITNLARMDTRLLQLLRDAKAGRFQYGVTPSAAVIETTNGIADLMNVPRELCLPDQITRLPCQVVHGKWVDSTSCEINTAKRWATAWLQSMGIYVPVHLLPRLIFGRQKLMRQPAEVLSVALQAAARSSAFLATFVASVWAGVCMSRTRLGPVLFSSLPQQVWDGGMAPMIGCMACGLSVLIESKRRRGEMALYVAPRALYAALDEILPAKLFQSSRGQLVARWSERFLLSLSMGVITTAGVHELELIRGVAKAVVGYMVGNRWRDEMRLKNR